MVQTEVGDFGEDVRERRHTAATESTARPGLRLPRSDGAVLLCADFDLREVGGPDTGDGEFSRTVEEKLYGTATACFGKLCAFAAPAVGRELRSKSTAHVIHLHVDLGGGHLEAL